MSVHKRPAKGIEATRGAPGMGRGGSGPQRAANARTPQYTVEFEKGEPKRVRSVYWADAIKYTAVMEWKPDRGRLRLPCCDSEWWSMVLLPNERSLVAPARVIECQCGATWAWWDFVIGVVWT